MATGGRLVIGGTTVTLSGSVTLQQLANAINATANVPAVASVVKHVSGYRLMLTGRETGSANGFTIDNNLTGGNRPRFTSVQASADARVTINGVTATSTSNTFQGVVPGLDFTALKADASNTVVITITASTDSVQALVDKLVTAYNETDQWVATAFYREPSCVRSNFNLLNFFDFANIPAIFGCPLTVYGFEVWKNSAATDPGPMQ